MNRTIYLSETQDKQFQRAQAAVRALPRDSGITIGRLITDALTRFADAQESGIATRFEKVVESHVKGEPL